MANNFDAIDERILAVLQTDSSLSSAEVADRVGISQAPCWRRIQRLRQSGIIRREVALVDRAKIGWNLQIVVLIHLSSHGRQNVEAFTAALAKHDRVLECCILLGNVDAMLRVVARDIADYERFFMDHLSQAPGVREANSMVILTEAKATTSLPMSQQGDA